MSGAISDQPRVSVIVPAYQAEATVDDALRSLQAQAFEAWEAVVVDDGSTDATAARVSAIGSEDSRVRLLSQANAGVSAARNAGLEVARGEWVLFLDADDRLAASGLPALMEAASPSVEWLHGGWARVTDGVVQSTQHAHYLTEPSDTLARSCPFAIHACLVRTSRVREVGGFDPSYVTCEDWDLWRRLAAAGVTPVSVDALVAEYVVRRASASMVPRQLLADGLRLIGAAHDDARRPDADRRAAQAAFCAYVAGIVIGQGDDPAWVLQERGKPALDTSPGWVAEMMHAGVPLGALVGTEHWPLSNEVAGRVDGWLAELERTTGAVHLARRAAARLEALVAASLWRSDELRRFGATLIVDLDLAAGDFDDVTLDDGVERVAARGWIDDEQVAGAEILPLTGRVAGVVLLDALLAGGGAWPAVEHCILAPRRAEQDGVDDWTVLLREVFADRDATSNDLYAARARGRSRSVRAGSTTQIELTDGSATIVGRGPITITATLGGEPLDEFMLAPRRGRVAAGRLRTQLAVRHGAALAEIAMRAYLSRPAGARDRAPQSAFAGEPANPAWLADPDVTRASHDGRPLAAALRLHAATSADVRGQTSALALPRDAVLPPAGEPSRGPAAFEALFLSEEDPWRYETGYETRKYEQTLELLPDAPAAVLELACAEGHFTKRLAQVAGRVVATDVSQLALARAQARVGGAANVEFRQHDLFRDPIEGRWPVIVCSEVLYYAGDVDDLAPVVRRIVGALEPGGALVTAHANLVVDDARSPGFDWDEAYGSLGIQRALLATGLVALEHELVTPMYRVQRYRRRSRLALRRAPQPNTEHVAPSDDLSADVRAHFLPDGGTPQGGRRVEWIPRRVPILMYHRVAPSGSDGLRRWRVTPDEFDAQLAFLGRAGYTSISLAEWVDAVAYGSPLPNQPIILTFDDGYVDFEEYALPRLQRHGFGATLFAVTDLVGETNSWDAHRETLPLMDWTALERIAAAGVELGGHTATHPPLTALTARRMHDEIATSLEALGKRLGQTPTAFAYPYGDLSAGVAGLASLAGAQIAVTCEDRVATDVDDLLLLPRIEVRGDGNPVEDLVRRLGAW